MYFIIPIMSLGNGNAEDVYSDNFIYILRIIILGNEDVTVECQLVNHLLY